ncbi:MAG TPA: 16S rRNA (guanine(527)-N(7))-methyltransferase RsmG [Dictyobacter sp.]|jgi:16S rRNA (guanine527-N7)-methyltransferase|nr:16S rRNA (guanine(527)-N(7))-methyltransferase RsmG [Dictyobacter sp.]
MAEERSEVFLAGLRQLDLMKLDMVGEDEQFTLYRAFMTYRRELLDWNTRMNLTAIKDPEEVLSKHFLDSLSLLHVIDGPELRLLDIGSGAGFPGMPLAIARPDWHITLLEATGKRVTFLQHMIDILQLEHVQAVQGRAEDLGRQAAYRGAYDVVTARAVSSFAVLLEYSAPLCRVGGVMVYPKKGDLTEEIAQGKRAASQVGARLMGEEPVQIAGIDDGRRLFVWEQQKKCPEKFPRSGSLISKKPLG